MSATPSAGSWGSVRPWSAGRRGSPRKGDLLPIAVRHYINAPGPFVGAVAPCDGNTNHFQDLISTANTSCLGSMTDASPRTMPNPGAPFNASAPDNDPVNHGPIITLVGQGASPSNAASFRGFVALDIRNFQYDSPSSNVLYNGVTPGMNANRSRTSKLAGSPPATRARTFRLSVVPPDPNDQVGIIDGNSTGIVIDEIDIRYGPGDEILAAVYSGHRPEHPRLRLHRRHDGDHQHQSEPRQRDHHERHEERVVHAASSTTTAFPDWGDPGHPWGTTLAPLAFTPESR